jgi:hypothetical protein
MQSLDEMRRTMASLEHSTSMRETQLIDELNRVKQDLHEASKSGSEIREGHRADMLTLEGKMSSEREKMLID